MYTDEITNLVQIGDSRDGSPIWLIQGGAPDDDEDEGTEIEVGGDEEEESEEEESEEESEEEEEEKPAAKKAPAKKVAPPAKKVAAKKLPPKKVISPLHKALRSERQLRLDAERQLKEIRKTNETQAETRAREAEEAAEAKYKPLAVSSAARAALIEAKFKGDAARGVKLMDMSAIEIYEGEAIGIDEQIVAMQAEFPEMFESEEDAARPKKKPPVKINPGNRKPADVGGKKLSSAEQIAAMYEDA